MSITITNILDIAPELSTASPSQIAAAIANADIFVNPTTWAEKTDIAKAYYAAHLLTLTRMRGTTGLGSEKVGDLQRAYMRPMALTALGLSSYGIQLDWMMRTLVITPIVVN